MRGAATRNLTLCFALLSASCGDDVPDPNAPVVLWRIPSTGSTSAAGRPAPPFPGFDAGVRDASWPPPIDAGAAQLDEDAGPPDPSLAALDPNEVYLFGPLSEGGCDYQAIVPVLDPNRALAGFSCEARSRPAVVRPLDGRLIYRTGDSLYAFHCDGCTYLRSRESFPRSLLDNDVRVKTPTCPFSSFTIATSGDPWIQCSDRHWSGPRGVVPALRDATRLVVGNQGTALVPNGIVALEGGTLIPFDGLELPAVIAARSHVDGYWLVVKGAAVYSAELWQIAFDGKATLQGKYPEPPPVQYLTDDGNAVLDGRGGLYQVGRRVSYDVVIRRSIDGESRVVYDEADDPVVKIHLSSLFTGP